MAVPSCYVRVLNSQDQLLVLGKKNTKMKLSPFILV